MSKNLQKWNKKYSAPEFVFGLAPNDFLAAQESLFSGYQTALLPGDGEGRNGLWMAGLGFEVMSVDGAQNGVDKCLKEAERQGLQDKITGVCADLLTWDWPVAAFDVVASMHLHFMNQERPAMHSAMLKALKPGGLFILEQFHPGQIGRITGGPQIPELCVTPEELAEQFKTCDILHLEECEKEVMETSFRGGGIGYVSRIVARKP